MNGWKWTETERDDGCTEATPNDRACAHQPITARVPNFSPVRTSPFPRRNHSHSIFGRHSRYAPGVLPRSPSTSDKAHLNTKGMSETDTKVHAQSRRMSDVFAGGQHPVVLLEQRPTSRVRVNHLGNPRPEAPHDHLIRLRLTVISPPAIPLNPLSQPPLSFLPPSMSSLHTAHNSR